MTDITVPKSVTTRACYTQMLGPLAIEPNALESILHSIEAVGIENILEQNAKLGPYPENTPAVYDLYERLQAEDPNAKIEYELPVTLAAERGSDDDEHRAGPPPYVTHNGTAIIPVSGPLSKHPSSLGHAFGGSSTIGMRKAMQLALADESVERIMFHIDSPGGTVPGTGDLGDDIFAAGQHKPIASFIEDMGASAAYWIASQTGAIYASKHSEVGSIGVVQVLHDQSKRAENAGVKVHVVKTGANKAHGVPGVAIGKETLDYFQGRVDAVNQNFIENVARGRNVSTAHIAKLADGGVRPAPKAKEAGLVDHISTFGKALAHFAGTKSLLRAHGKPAAAPAAAASLALPHTITNTHAQEASLSGHALTVSDGTSPDGTPSNTPTPPPTSESEMPEEPNLETAEERLRAKAPAPDPQLATILGELKAIREDQEKTAQEVAELRKRDEERLATSEDAERQRIADAYDIPVESLAAIKGVEALTAYEDGLKLVAAKTGAAQLPRFMETTVTEPDKRLEAYKADQEERKAWLQGLGDHTQVITSAHRRSN